MPPLGRRDSKTSEPVLGLLTKEHSNKAVTSPTHKDRGIPVVHKFSFLYSLLNPRSRQWQAELFKTVISTVILVDLLSFILATEPSLADYYYYFNIVEGISSTVFFLEYIGRLTTCVEKHRYGLNGPILGRLHFMIQFSSLIDVLAMSPFFLEPLVGFTLPRLTFLRFFRLFRITRTSSYMRATDACYRVIYYNREILSVAFFVCILLVLGTGLLMYFLRPHDPKDAQHFESIMATMYLSTLMLTGQGGPEGELPWYTKAVVLLTSIVSVAMFAIPASMLTWGFEAEAARVAKRSYEKSRRVKEGIDSSDDDYSTDEEYQKFIAGVEDGGDGDDSEAAMDAYQRQLLEMFQKADEDGSGSLTLKEFVELSSAHQSSSGGPALSAVATRVKLLETQVQSNSKKLDRILELLESKKAR